METRKKLTPFFSLFATWTPNHAGNDLCATLQDHSCHYTLRCGQESTATMAGEEQWRKVTTHFDQFSKTQNNSKPPNIGHHSNRTDQESTNLQVWGKISPTLRKLKFQKSDPKLFFLASRFSKTSKILCHFLAGWKPPPNDAH